MRDVGFVDVNMLLYWSDPLGYYGMEQMMIIARKTVRSTRGLTLGPRERTCL